MQGDVHNIPFCHAEETSGTGLIVQDAQLSALRQDDAMRDPL
ncbi:MAG: hypothetical protein RLT87_00880 [Gammaproteobacteria bacterium]